jgi:AraC-like DNA-binding protein
MERLNSTPKARRLDYFLRFYFLYAAVFIAPILLLSVVLNVYVIGQIRQESVRNTLNALASVWEYLDSQFARTTEISNKILYESNPLKPFSVMLRKPHVERAQMIASQLGAMRSSESIVDEIGLYFHGSDTVYTSESVYSAPLFAKLYEIEPESAADAVDSNARASALLNSLETRVARTRGSYFNRRPYLIMTRPGQSGSVKMTFIYFMSVERLQRLILMANPILGSNVMIVHNGKAVFELYPFWGTDGGGAPLQWEMLRNDPYQIVSTVQGKYYLFARSSTASPFDYLFAVSEREILGRSPRTQATYTAAIFLLLFVEGIILYISINRIYRPVRALKQYTESVVELEPRDEDDVDIIRYALDRLLWRNSELTAQLERDRLSARNNLLHRLISGEIASFEDFNQIGEALGMRISKSTKWVISLIPSANAEANTIRYKETFVQAAERCLPYDIEGYCAFNPGVQRFIMLVAADKNPISFERLGETFYNTLIDKPRGKIVMGVSNCFSLAEETREAYIQSIAAARYSFMDGASLIHYNDLEAPCSGESYPLAEIRQVSSALRMGDAMKVRDLCARFKDAIRRSANFQHTVRRLCYDIVGIVDECLSENDKNASLTEKLASDITLLDDFETADDFIAFIETICLRCCEICSQAGTEKRDQAKRIREFVDLNYMTKDFSVQTVAEYFQMSASNLSHLFKTQTGDTILNYLISRKIRRACELLNQGVRTEEVARRLEYQNTSSFIRRFKLNMGMTPGEYRKLTLNSK